MPKTISMAEARGSFSELVNRVAFGKERYIVERRGKPLAALVSAAEYHRLVELLGDAGVTAEIHGIPVRIRYDGERYFVSDDVVNLYGVGTTPEEAEQDYWLAANDYYADLTANKDRLCEPMRKHLKVLRRVFAKGGS